MNWLYIALPNITYIQLGARFTIIQFAEKIIDLKKLDSMEMFNLAFFLQFVGWLAVYYVLDRTISTDTGAQRQLISTAAATLEEAPTIENNQESSRAGLLTQEPHGQLTENVIKIRGLVKQFGDFTAIKGLNADIRSNCITALLGHNGAGKTTLIDILTGFQAPTEGGVFLNGENIHTNHELLYGRVGYASSHDPLFEELSVEDFLTLMAQLKGCEDPKGEAFKVARETHLEPHLKKKIRECSGGTKRRVSISSSLVGNPSIIFFDEPSTGVDPENRRALWQSIGQMKRPDRIILLTTHHLEEAEFLSRDVIILTKGQISCRGAPETIKAELGIGYKLILSNLQGREQEAAALLGPYEPYMKVNRDKLQSIGELTIEMEKNTEKATIEIMERLDGARLVYTILASTLEDAFIHMAEKEETAEKEQQREDIINALFVKKFQTDNTKKFFALILRKWYLLFRSMLQVLVIVLLVAVPSAIYYLIISISYTTTNSDSKQNPVKIRNIYYGIINIICIIYYTFSCGFFGLVPCIERVGRIRYLMKMNNVSWVSYIPTLLIPDIAIALGVILCTYGVSYLSVSDIMHPISNSALLYLGLNLFVWMLTFIAQSYFISFFFQSKEKAYKSLTSVLLLSNLLALLGIFFVALLRSPKLNEITVEIFNVLFPGYANIAYCASTLSSGAVFVNADLYKILLRSLICFVLFMSLAIFLDYYTNKIQVAENITPPADSGFNPVYDPESVAHEARLATSESTEYPIQITNISKRFMFTTALKDVNLVVKPQEILGLIGPNGAGKSTLFNIVSNYFSPSMGQIKYHGRSLDQHLDFYDQTGLCAQDDIIWPELSVDQHLRFYGKLKGVDETTIELWKKLMDLDGFGDFNSINLSTGMKRKLCYIISMMTNPQYKFLDEPTSGLDPVSRKLMRKLIAAQKRIYGGSCVYTTHTMKDAEDLCDRVAILVNGRLTCIDTVNNLRTKTGGINVSILRNIMNPHDEQNIMGVYCSIFPECLDAGKPIVTEVTERKFVFFAQNITSVPAKMRLMADSKAQGFIVDFEVSQRSLEDLFLYLARGQQGRGF